MIVCFTGTGNSRAVALRLAERLGDGLYMIEGEAASAPSAVAPLGLRPEDKGRVIWVFPVYSWGVPPVVARFILDVRVSEGFARAEHRMVCTCGDDAGMTDRVFRRLVGSRGWECAPEAFSVIMPNTYTLMKGFDVDSPEVRKAKLDAMPAAVERIAGMIEGREEMRPMFVRGGFARLKTGIVYPWFKRFAMSPKPFRSTGACTVCGACARKCPLGNITMTADGPQWGANCALCLRCYHVCPRHAVAYGKATDGKGQYLCPARNCPPDN